MESENGDVGESVQELHKGESFCGVTFEKFMNDGTGKMEIQGVDE